MKILSIILLLFITSCATPKELYERAEIKNIRVVSSLVKTDSAIVETAPTLVGDYFNTTSNEICCHDCLVKYEDYQLFLKGVKIYSYCEVKKNNVVFEGTDGVIFTLFVIFIGLLLIFVIKD